MSLHSPHPQRRLLLALVAALAALALIAISIATGSPSSAASRPLPPLDVQITKITTSKVYVSVVCPDDPPAYLIVSQTSPARQLAFYGPVTCLRTRTQHFVLPLDPGVTLTNHQDLGPVSIQFSGDSGEINNAYADVRVGERLRGGLLN